MMLTSFLGIQTQAKLIDFIKKRTLVLEESMHVTFNEFNPSSIEKVVVNDNADEELQEESSTKRMQH